MVRDAEGNLGAALQCWTLSLWWKWACGCLLMHPQSSSWQWCWCMNTRRREREKKKFPLPTAEFFGAFCQWASEWHPAEIESFVVKSMRLWRLDRCRGKVSACFIFEILCCCSLVSILEKKKVLHCRHRNLFMYEQWIKYSWWVTQKESVIRSTLYTKVSSVTGSNAQPVGESSVVLKKLW